MFAEKHQDSNYVEQEFRRSLKYYRSLLRWGIDKVFYDANVKIEALFDEARLCLQKDGIEQAGAALEQLDARLLEMEKNYPQIKNNLLSSIKSSIDFLEHSLAASAKYTSVGYDKFRDEALKNLECARAALQNEDWEQAKRVADSVYAEILTAQQSTLLAGDYALLDGGEVEEVGQKVGSAFEAGLACRLVSEIDLDKMFQMAETRGVVTLRIGVFASKASIERLFTDLAKKEIEFSASPEGFAALLRIPVNREMTIYVVGAPVEERKNSAQFQRVAGQYSMLFMSAGQIFEEGVRSHELLLSCADKLAPECVNLFGDVLGEDNLNRLVGMGVSYPSDIAPDCFVSRVLETIDKAFIYR